MPDLHSRLDQLSSEKDPHYTYLDNAIYHVLGEYVETRGFREKSADDFQAYELAHLKAIGFNPDHPCDIDTWNNMGDLRDPLVTSVIEFIKAERQVLLDLDETTFGQEILFWDLISFARGNALGSRMYMALGEIKWPVMISIRTLNDTILTLASELDHRNGIYVNKRDLFEETGISMNSIMVASQIIAYIMDSYPVGSLTQPAYEK